MTGSHRLALAAVLIGAAALRLHGIGSDSLWLDEAVSWRQASLGLRELLRATAGDNYPPLHNLLLHAWILGFGDGELALRLPSALLGVAGVAAVYWVGVRVRGPSVGLVAAALLALSGFHVWYSQEARPYALLALTSTLFVGSTLRALETRRAAWQAAAGCAALLLLYSHPYGLLLWLSIVAAVVAAALASRDPAARALSRWAAGQAIAALLFLPWAQFLALRYQHIVTAGFWLERPDLRFVLTILRDLASGPVMAWILAVGAALGLAAPARAPERDGEAERASQRSATLRRFVLAAWLLGPLLLGLAASLLSQPILHRRYLIGSLPAWMIVAACGWDRLSQRWGGWVLASLVAAAIASAYLYAPQRRQDFRTPVAAYLAQAQPGDCVIVHRHHLDDPILYYVRPPPACFQRARQSEDIRPWELASPRAWLFLGHVREEERRAIAEALREHGWQTRTVSEGRAIRLLLATPAR